MNKLHSGRAHEYGGIDSFRMVAAFLIIGIHIDPLESVNEIINYGLVHILSRVAVPFFLMVTGYFVLPKYFAQKPNKKNSSVKNSAVRKPVEKKASGGKKIATDNTKKQALPMKFIKRTALIYAGATLLYLPVSIYAGYYSDGNIALTFLKNLVFDGTFYHLWYLPAAIIGVLLVWLLSRIMSLRAVFAATLCLYVVGLFGDSYYGVAQQAPAVLSVYDALFAISSHTRNGIFLAPVFLALGAMLEKSGREPNERFDIAGLSISMSLMLIEGYILYYFDSPRHDSMYIALVPCMYFLFRVLLSDGGKPRPALRDISLWIYILHPLFIIAVRGAARLIGMTDILVGNSVILYLSVSLLSLLAAMLVEKGKTAISKRNG